MKPFMHPVQQPILHDVKRPSLKKTTQPKQSFQEALSKAKTIKMSKHAKQRMHERNINISEEKWKLIDQKVKEAREKGVKDSLVVMQEATLVVNTTNSIVITALDSEEATERIFTNINGTIVINE